MVMMNWTSIGFQDYQDHLLLFYKTNKEGKQKIHRSLLSCSLSAVYSHRTGGTGAWNAELPISETVPFTRCFNTALYFKVWHRITGLFFFYHYCTFSCCGILPVVKKVIAYSENTLSYSILKLSCISWKSIFQSNILMHLNGYLRFPLW